MGEWFVCFFFLQEKKDFYHTLCDKGCRIRSQHYQNAFKTAKFNTDSTSFFNAILILKKSFKTSLVMHAYLI